MDDTGLPISTSRESTMPRMGERMVALASSSSERSTAACAWATAARACATRASLTPSCDLAIACRLVAWSSTLRASSRFCAEMSFWPASCCARSTIPLGKRHLRAFRLDAVLGQFRLGGLEAGVGAARAPRAPHAGARRGCRDPVRPAPGPPPPGRRLSTFSSLMMPLAFDLISTFVIGSIFPVATTERARSPRSTVARRDASTVVTGRAMTRVAVEPERAQHHERGHDRQPLAPSRLRHDVTPSLPRRSPSHPVMNTHPVWKAVPSRRALETRSRRFAGTVRCTVEWLDRCICGWSAPAPCQGAGAGRRGKVV